MSRVLPSDGQNICIPFSELVTPSVTCGNELVARSSDVSKMQAVMDATPDRDMPSLLDDDMSSLRASNTEKSVKQRRSFLQPRTSWLSRRRTGSTRRSRLDDESTIATRLTTKLPDLVETHEEGAIQPFQPITLSVLYDDKRNEVAWLRCAPRRRGFDFPIQKEQRDQEEKEAAAPLESSRVDDPSEERDAHPTVDERDVAEHGKLMRGDDWTRGPTVIDDEDSPEIKTAGSTITTYKRKLADLQRRHEAVIKIIQQI